MPASICKGRTKHFERMRQMNLLLSFWIVFTSHFAQANLLCEQAFQEGQSPNKETVKQEPSFEKPTSQDARIRQAFKQIDSYLNKEVTGALDLLSSILQKDNPDQNGLTHFIALHNRPEFIDPLIREGFLFSETNIHGETPLYLAAREGHKEVVLTLLKKGFFYANTNPFIPYPLVVAVQNSHLEIAKALIYYGGVPDHYDFRAKKDAFSAALEQGNTEIFKELLKGNNRKLLGAPMNHFQYLNRIFYYENSKEFIQTVVETQRDYFNTGVKDSHGNTPFHLAVLKNKLEEAEILLKASLERFHAQGGKLHPFIHVKSWALGYLISINATNKEGKTALDLAIELDRADMAAMLSRYGAKRSMKHYIKDLLKS